MPIDGTALFTAGSAAAVALSGIMYQASTKTGRTLRRARARIEVLERYARRTRGLLDEFTVPEDRWRYPAALRYLEGAEDPDDDGGQI